jgi:two-component system, OmpR family, KDP operon response regulator KdpE
MSSKSRTILIVEDDAQIRKFLRISLEAHGYMIVETRLGEEGLERCAAVRPDLVVLDLGLPDLDGQVVIERLRAWSSVPIIVLSVRSSEEEKVKALDAGANDYITKPFGISEFMARLRALLRREEQSVSAPPVFESGGLRVDRALRKVTIDGMTVHLTKKEYELLNLLVNAAGRVLTHQHILTAIWGEEHRAQTHYLRVLVQQLRQKLGDEPTNPRFIFTVQGVGYRLALPVGEE